MAKRSLASVEEVSIAQLQSAMTNREVTSRFLDRDGLRGARIGVAWQVFFGYSPKADRLIEGALAVMRAAGATIVDPADIPTAQQIATDPAELTVLLYEFKADLNVYLATRLPNLQYPDIPPMHTLGGSSSPAAIAGYRLVSVPAGYVNGLPVGITFMGRPGANRS